MTRMISNGLARRMMAVAEAVEAAGELAIGPAEAPDPTPLGPAAWDDFVGQDDAKYRLRVSMDAAILGERMLGHTLLVGPPGSGKTTMARLIAGTMGQRLIEVDHPLAGFELAAKVWQAEGGILFVDELHQWTTTQVHPLMQLMEAGTLPGDPSRKNVTVVAATTEPQMLFQPLVDRFKIRPDWAGYTDIEMATILGRMLDQLDVAMPADQVALLSKAAVGVPRYARNLAEAARDLHDADEPAGAFEVFAFVGLDPDGLTGLHRRYLTEVFHAGAIGLETLRSILQVHPNELRDVERLLLRARYIVIGGRGRQLTPAGRARVAPIVAVDR